MAAAHHTPHHQHSRSAPVNPHPNSTSTTTTPAPTATNLNTERIENALHSLLERLVPAQLHARESASAADARWHAAHARATAILSNANGSGPGGEGGGAGADANHAADRIARRLRRDPAGPARAAAFGNLYSRLLAQPVLTKKWAILWFLSRVAEDVEEEEAAEREREEEGEEGEEEEGGDEDQEREMRRLLRERALQGQQQQQQGRGSVAAGGGYREREREQSVPEFDEAFARNGLPRLARSQQQSQESSLPPAWQDRDRAIPARSRPQEAPQQQQQQPPASPIKRPTSRDAPAETTLLRDLPFTLQGLSSTHLVFADAPASSTTSSPTLKLPATLPVPLVALLHSLAEPSLLYRSLAEFVESSDGGLVGQSLRAAIAIELRSYLSLVATLEGQIRRALAPFEQDDGAGDTAAARSRAGVTLKRCVVWTRDATLGLRLMSSLIVAAAGKSGGELISLIHSFAASHGDPFVHTFAERLLTQVTRPFYHMLRAWIYDGELEDPYCEFFVSENPDHEDRSGGATSVWEHKYRLRESMIPAIMTAEFADKVFLIGKSLNFIREACADGGWVEAYSKSASRELAYGDTATLEASIDEAYAAVMARLIHLMETKFALFAHLSALKKYLLLGQGDFIALLMESLAANLDRPANSQYRHTLTAQLEHAIRNSNAQHEPADVLSRLDARMLELSHGEIGWDVFTLEYRVNAPLDVIVTPWASKQYLKVFNFLWRVKRVEFALASTWRRLQTGARGVLAAVGDNLGPDWKAARAGVAEMIHFVAQLQYYILFEVIEAGWAGLQKAMRKPGATLDTLITAHTTYLRSITRKGLLGGGSSSAGGATIDFTTQLHELLKLMLAYRDAVDGLYSFSVAEYSRRQELAAKIETRTRAGRWGLTEADELASTPDGGRGVRDDDNDAFPPPLLPLPGTAAGSSGPDGERTLLAQLRGRLQTLARDFHARVNILLGDLAYQPDVDMRFLAVVMNFNEVYAPVKRRRQHHHQSKTSGAAAAAGQSAAGSVAGQGDREREKERTTSGVSAKG